MELVTKGCDDGDYNEETEATLAEVELVTNGCDDGDYNEETKQH